MPNTETKKEKGKRGIKRGRRGYVKRSHRQLVAHLLTVVVVIVAMFVVVFIANSNVLVNLLAFVVITTMVLDRIPITLAEVEGRLAGADSVTTDLVLFDLRVDVGIGVNTVDVFVRPRKVIAREAVGLVVVVVFRVMVGAGDVTTVVVVILVVVLVVLGIVAIVATVVVLVLVLVSIVPKCDTAVITSTHETNGSSYHFAYHTVFRVSRFLRIPTVGLYHSNAPRILLGGV
jgi:hypothetical protein